MNVNAAATKCRNAKWGRRKEERRGKGREGKEYPLRCQEGRVAAAPYYKTLWGDTSLVAPSEI